MKKFIGLLLIITSIFFTPKSAKALTAQLVITNDVNFASKWNNALGDFAPYIHTFKQVYRGDVVHLRLFFWGMALDENGKANVDFDVEIINPAGKLFFSDKNLAGVKKQAAKAGNVFLADTFVANRFREMDMLGKYRVRLLVRDNIAKTRLMLEDKLVLIEYRSDKTQLTNEELNKFVMSYYEKPNSHWVLQIFNLIYANKGENEKPGFVLHMAAFLRAVFENNDYLVPHLIEYINKLENDKLTQIIPVIKAIAMDFPQILPKLNLDTDELALLARVNYPDIWDNELEGAHELDMLWTYFFATGEIKPILKLADLIKLKNSKDPQGIILGGAAIWSLASNCKQHPLVRAYCAYIYKNATPMDEFTKENLKKFIENSSYKKEEKGKKAPPTGKIGVRTVL